MHEILLWFSARPSHAGCVQVLVEYVDYGNEEEVDRLKLRKALDTELFSLPPQVTYREHWRHAAIPYSGFIHEFRRSVKLQCAKILFASTVLPIR